jgi:tetratricopeptide (TPR) repeat protein
LSSSVDKSTAQKPGLRHRCTAVFLAATTALGPMLATVGCASPQEKSAHTAVADFYAGEYRRAAAQLQPLSQRTDENFVLNNLRLGSIEMIEGKLDLAQAAFLRAYEVINSVDVNNGGRTLGAVLVSEKIKIWKGEPYERAMANFYLGLTYYIQHDYNNARAAFENALFKLRDYASNSQENHQDYSEQESTFVIGLVMLGRCWQRLGRDDLAKANFDRARQLRPDLEALIDPHTEADSNLLLVVEFGRGPRKIRDSDGSLVGFAPTPEEAGRIPSPRVSIDGETVDTYPFREAPIDLLQMAQERRWQDIDTIRAIKSVVGTGLIVGGAVEGARGVTGSGGRGRTDLIVGASLLAAGLLMKASSQADTRYWEMLPRTVFLLPLRVTPGRHDVVVEFPRAGLLRTTVRGIEVPSQGEATYDVRVLRQGGGEYELSSAQ